MSSANQPGRNQLHVNRPLTNIAIAYMQSADAFAYRRAFPAIPVDNKSDSYYVMRLADMYRDDMRPRAPGTESAGSGYNFDLETYVIKRWDLHKDIPDDLRQEADAPLNLDTATTAWLTQQGMIRQERIFASSYFTAGIWGTDITGTSGTPGAGQTLVWTDDAADPVQAIQAAITEAQLKTGMRPNVITMARDVRNALNISPSMIDRVKYSGGVGPNSPVTISDQMIATVFGVEEVIVSDAIMNTQAEGVAPVNEFILRGKLLLSYRPRTPGIMVPSSGYRFNWRGLLGNEDGIRIKRFRMEHLEADRIEIALATTSHVTAAGTAVLFSGLVG